MIRAGATLESNGRRVSDPSYMIDAVTSDETAFGDGQYAPGYVGVDESHVTAEGVPGVFPTPSAYAYKGAGTEETIINQEEGGKPGRVNRLAYDSKGPAYSGSTADFAITGRRITPTASSAPQEGPVGYADYRSQAAIAIAQSTKDFPDEAISQLRVMLGG